MINYYSGNTPVETDFPAPNKETIAAIKEVELMKKNPSEFKSYTDVDKMIDELISE